MRFDNFRNLKLKKMAASISTKEEKIDLALSRYSNKEVSLARAAEIAKIPLVDMLRIAAEKKVPLHYSKEDLLKDITE